MSAAAGMAIVVFVFFLVGVAVGVLVVIAASARRAHKAGPQVRPAGPQVRPVATPPGTWPYLPGHDPRRGRP